MAKAKNKFRVGVAARTVDGREIKREYIEKAASSYNLDVYGARINLEHIRAVMPDSPFKALGDVLSLEFKTEKVGDQERPVIYAELEPTDELIAMNKAGQKVYTSMELQPDFPEPGDWYMVGLAVTDSPASMGTQRLSFSAAKQGENLIGEYSEAELLFSDEETDESEDTRPGIVDRIKQTFAKLRKETNGKNSELESAIELIAQEFTALAETMPSQNEIADLKNELASMQEKFSAQGEELKELSDAMESMERFESRPPATGGDTAHLTDC